MLEAIIFLWMAIRLQAPTWVFVIIGILLTLEIVGFIADVLTKIAERKWKGETWGREQNNASSADANTHQDSETK